MDLKWLEDLVAIAEAESLTDAAMRRHLTQPAFSRRVRSIEDWLGTTAIDRTTRPARLKKAVIQQLPEIRSILRQVEGLRRTIQAGDDAQPHLTICGLHSITTGFLPAFILKLRDQLPPFGIRLISGDRDESYAMLMTRQVALLVVYETERLPVAPDEILIEKRTLALDRFVPVAAPEVVVATNGLRNRHLPIIAYPSSNFFGATLQHDALPLSAARHDLEVVCETAFVPGALEFALAGLGVAWIPLRLAEPYFEPERLVRLDRQLGSVRLTIVAARLDAPAGSLLDQVWKALLAYSASLSSSES